MTRAPFGPLSAKEVARLYGTFNRRLSRIVRSSVPAPATVIEDACQVAWTGLLCQPGLDRGGVRAWLVRTAVREALRLSRLERREDSFEWALEERALNLLPAGDGGLENLMSARDRVQGVRLLSARQQRLVWLRAFGFSYEEIAAYERCTSRTVRRQLERARTVLRSLDDGGAVHRAAA